MSYSGSVTVIDGLVPANGQDFPLVNAGQVYVDDDTRLSKKLADMDDQLSDALYKALTIDSMSISPNVVEKGSTVRSITVTYSLNKVPTTGQIDLLVNGSTTHAGVVNITDKSKTIEITGYPMTSNSTITLKAEDSGSHSNPKATPSKSLVLNFYNKIYYGPAAVPSAINDAFLLNTATFTKELIASRAKQFTVTAGAGQYVWFALPSAYGIPTFNVGGFDGGVSLVATFEHTNASGRKEVYRVYRSDNANIGTKVVKVS